MGIQRLEGRIFALRRRFGQGSITTVDVVVASRWQGRKAEIALYCLPGNEPGDPQAAVRELERGRPLQRRLRFMAAVFCPHCGGGIGTHNVSEGKGRDLARAECEHCGITWRARVVAGALVSVSREER